MKWTDYENETLIHNHKVSKVFKKKYKRASEFHNALYRLFGILTVLSSTISTTLIWSLDLQQDELYYSNTTYSIIDHNFNIIPIKLIVFLSAFTASIQNFYKFQDNSNNYLITSNLYSNIKGKIEAVGNIHPEYRTITPSDFFKKIQDKSYESTFKIYPNCKLFFESPFLPSQLQLLQLALSLQFLKGLLV